MPKIINIDSFLENFTDKRAEIEAQILEVYSNLMNMPEDVFITNLLVKDSTDKKEFFLNDIYLFEVTK